MSRVRVLAVFLIAAVLGSGALARARSDSADVGALASEGVDAYRRGDLASARALWLSALESAAGARARATLLYDLGNVAYREGRALEAAGWYTASLRVAPRNADAWANLEFAREQANVAPADRGDLLATFRRMLSALTLAESEWLVLVCGALFGAALVFEALRGGALARRLSFAGLALVVLALAPWLYNLRDARRDPLFVVASEGATVRSEPRGEAAVVGRLSPATEVERRDTLPGWVRVSDSADASGLQGWVESTAVFALEGPFALEHP